MTRPLSESSEARRKREARALARADRLNAGREMGSHEASAPAVDVPAVLHELLAANRQLVEAQRVMVASFAELARRLADVFGRPESVRRTSEVSGRTSGKRPPDVPEPSEASAGVARAETEIPSLSEEEPRDSKTSSGDLKIDPRADATGVRDVSEVSARTSEDASEVSDSDSSVRLATARHTNATADGAGGLGVSAWAEGIRSVTKKPFMPPRGGSSELAKLVEALVTFAPDAATRVEWARAEGKRFAETARGKLSAHSFVDWLNSPEERAATPAALVEGPAVLEERARRKAAQDEAEQNAAPPPPELLAMVGIKPKKGAA